MSTDTPAVPAKVKKPRYRKALTPFTRIRKRYQILTVESVAAALRKLKGNISAVARYHGVDRTTVHNFIERHYDTLGAIREEAATTVIDHVEYNLYDLAEQGEQWAVHMFLGAKARDRGYARTPGLVGGPGADGQSIPLIQIFLPDNFRGPVRGIESHDEVISNGEPGESSNSDHPIIGASDTTGTDHEPASGEVGETERERHERLFSDGF